MSFPAVYRLECWHCRTIRGYLVHATEHNLEIYSVERALLDTTKPSHRFNELVAKSIDGQEIGRLKPSYPRLKCECGNLTEFALFHASATEQSLVLLSDQPTRDF